MKWIEDYFAECKYIHPIFDSWAKTADDKRALTISLLKGKELRAKKRDSLILRVFGYVAISGTLTYALFGIWFIHQIKDYSVWTNSSSLILLIAVVCAAILFALCKESWRRSSHWKETYKKEKYIIEPTERLVQDLVEFFLDLHGGGSKDPKKYTFALISLLDEIKKESPDTFTRLLLIRELRGRAYRSKIYKYDQKAVLFGSTNYSDLYRRGRDLGLLNNMELESIFDQTYECLRKILGINQDKKDTEGE